MALSGTTNKQSFSPAAGTTSLTFSLPFFDTVLAGDSGTTKKFGDIKVARETSAGVITQLTPTSGVVGADNFKIAATNGDPAQGCTVTIASSTAGDKYIVERDIAYTQEYDLQEGATIDPTALNKAFDRVVAQNQQQNDELSRSITFPVTDADSITYNVDSSATDRAGKVLGFDSNGNVTELAQISGSASVDTGRGLQLVNNQVGVKDDGITSQFIADDAVGADQLASNSVVSDSIVNGTIAFADLASAAIESIRTTLYPVGSIFTTTAHSTASAVNTALGFGTWEAFGAGKVMVGHDPNDSDFDAASPSTGGAKTHALTFDEMPAHSHQWYKQGSGSGQRIDATTGNPKFNSFDSDGNEEAFGDPLSEDLYTDTATDRSSDGTAHNNLQPYIAVYMWKRTA